MEEQTLTQFLRFPVCSGLVYEAQLNCLSVTLSLSIRGGELRWRCWKSKGGGKEKWGWRGFRESKERGRGGNSCQAVVERRPRTPDSPSLLLPGRLITEANQAESPSLIWGLILVSMHKRPTTIVVCLLDKPFAVCVHLRG